MNVKGKGHLIDLDVNVPKGRIQDFLELAVKTEPAVMTGRVNMKTKLQIRPGNERVIEKLGMKRCGTRLHELLGEVFLFEARR